MKQNEFNNLFPRADKYRFKPDYDGTMVFVNDDYTLVDVESNAFFNDYSHVKYLNLPNDGLSWWRDDHFEFLKQWRRAYKYKNRDLFPLKDKPISVKPSNTWGPLEWDVSHKIVKSPPIVQLTNEHNVNLESFRIYVNMNDFFMLNSKFPWNLSNVEKIDFTDPKNNYCQSLKLMYVLSHLTGIGLKNLNSNNPLAKSLAHFYFFYHIRKMFNYRDFSHYDVSQVEKFPWTLYSWTNKFVWYHPQIKYTKDSLKYHSSDIISGIHVDGNKVYYKVRGKNETFPRIIYVYYQKIIMG